MKKLFKKMFKGNTLYYPGCLTKFVLKDIMENYKKILEKEGIDFIMLKEKELCCGSPLKNAGMQDKYKEVAKKNLAVFKEHGVDRIISNCPACVVILGREYKEMLGNKWDIEVRHMTEIIDLRKYANQKGSGEATYHDPCHLGRELGCYEQPRKIIEHKGYSLKEMDLNRSKSFCCGGGGGIKSNNKELANRIGRDRIGQAKKTGAKILFTPCPMCYANLKENTDSDLAVIELSEIIK